MLKGSEKRVEDVEDHKTYRVINRGKALIKAEGH